jgi:putative FmdB family regulatory protein
MPLYEYECTACRKRTEKIQKFSDPEITICPHCGGPLERVLSAPAIAFKGGGWYADGYGNAKPKSAGDKSDSSGGESKATESKSSDSKGGDSGKSESAKPSSEKSGSDSSSATPVAAPAAPAASPSSSNKK